MLIEYLSIPMASLHAEMFELKKMQINVQFDKSNIYFARVRSIYVAKGGLV
jgi:hypothetical protein